MLWLSLLVPPLTATVFYLIGHYNYRRRETEDV